jgi:hypothetical protein
MLAEVYENQKLFPSFEARSLRALKCTRQNFFFLNRLLLCPSPSNLYLAVDKRKDNHASLPENRDARLDGQGELPKSKEVAHGLLHH